MLFKLKSKIDCGEIKKINKYWSGFKMILKYVNFKCFALSFTGKGKYSYLECFGVYEPAAQIYSQKSTYNLIIPNRIIKSGDEYYVETEKEKGVWYKGFKRFNGNIELLSGYESLFKAFKSCGYYIKVII